MGYEIRKQAHAHESETKRTRANHGPDSPPAPIPPLEPTECILPLEPKTPEPHPNQQEDAMLDFSGRGAAAMTARDVPTITGGASEGVSRRNRPGGSVAAGWGRELNLRHCQPGYIRLERYRDSELSFRPHSPDAHFVGQTGSLRGTGSPALLPYVPLVILSPALLVREKCTYST
jgi:hypothetical protein